MRSRSCSTRLRRYLTRFLILWTRLWKITKVCLLKVRRHRIELALSLQLSLWEGTGGAWSKLLSFSILEGKISRCVPLSWSSSKYTKTNFSNVVWARKPSAGLRSLTTRSLSKMRSWFFETPTWIASKAHGQNIPNFQNKILSNRCLSGETQSPMRQME